MVHKSMAYRAEISWYLKILLIKHSRARSDEQELEKKTRNSLPVKNILAVKNWNFLTGLWKHLAINHMETHLSLLYFFFPRTKRVAFFIYLPFFFFFSIKDPTWRKEQWNNFLALPVILLCDREVSNSALWKEEYNIFSAFNIIMENMRPWALRSIFWLWVASDKKEVSTFSVTAL